MLYNLLLRYFDFEYRSRSNDNKEFGDVLYSVFLNYFDFIYKSKYVSGYDKESLDSLLYNLLLKFIGFKYDDKDDGICDNWYKDFDLRLEDRYVIKGFKEIYDD